LFVKAEVAECREQTVESRYSQQIGTVKLCPSLHSSIHPFIHQQLFTKL